jgi:uncharacterized protein
LMVRHPHFTQPVFVRFPRPSVLTGRLGVERFPAAPVEDFDAAMLRRLRRFDSGLTLDWLRTAIALADEPDVIRAVRATEREAPRDAKTYFAAQFRRQVAPRELAAPQALVQPLALPGGDDPYGF